MSSVLLSYIAGPVTNKSSEYGIDNYKHFRSSTQPTHTKVVKEHVRTGELNSTQLETFARSVYRVCGQPTNIYGIFLAARSC